MTARSFLPTPGLLSRRSVRVVERNALIARRSWPLFVTDALEPYLFLFSIGVGVGALVPDLIDAGGAALTYRDFVAPGLLAGSTMNAAVFAASADTFVKLRYLRTYDAMIATPIAARDVATGELAWIVARTTVYAAAYAAALTVLGITSAGRAILALPVVALVAFAFGGVGLAGTTFMTTWLDFDRIQMALVPTFLFSATFFPLDVYPNAVQPLVRISPLYHAAELLRAILLHGRFDREQVMATAYLAVIGLTGLTIAQRRLGRILNH